MTIALITVFAFVACFGDTAGARQGAPPVGYVLSLNGPWQLNGREVKRGEGVPANAHVVLAASARFDTGQDYSLDIVLLNNKPVGCHSADACRAGLTVPGALNENGSLSQRLSKVFARLFTTPDRWVGLVSRGAPSRLDLNDAVIKTDGRDLRVGQLLERAPAANYRVSFLPAAQMDPAARAYTLYVTWTTNAPTTVRASVQPGLYTATLTPNRTQAVSGREAWVLVTDAAHFTAASADFAQAIALTRTWGPDVPPNDVARFLHAFLADLAAEIR